MSPVPASCAVDLSSRVVDCHAVKTGQAFLILGLILAYLLDAWLLVAFTGAVMLLSAAVPAASLPNAIYEHLLRPSGIVKPKVRPDNPEPHRFSQAIGGSSALLATMALLSGATTLGWAICLVVVVLASLNLFASICVGERLYYQLHRLGVPGFSRSPLQSGR